MICIGEGARASLQRWSSLAGLTGLLLISVPAQSPAPGGVVPSNYWVGEGERYLDREDPVRAWVAFQLAAEVDHATPDCEVGLGKAHLMLGRSAFAHRYAESVLASAPDDEAGMELCIRALIRARAFDAAVRRASQFLVLVEEPGADLIAARASALFRVQRVDDAARLYRRVVGLEPRHAEAHLRLGSGLLPPVEVVIGRELHLAVAAARQGRHRHAIALLLEVAKAEPGNPVVHRLLGESLFAERHSMSMASADPAFQALAQALPVANVHGLPVMDFVKGYAELPVSRRAVVNRAVAMFSRYLDKLIAIGSRHDLLHELERTTDATQRASLRGKRTFDGRVWDDVRGIGGMRAATGIEALDEAAAFGFDTIVHEMAHQVHFYAFTPLQRARIKDLYRRALEGGRCIDYYAASNEAEYFGQGVEAFASFGKRPGGETTHGHTRFELYRVDPELHDFVASVVDCDPLDDPLRRDRILAAAVRVALRCGRPDDAVIAADWMGEGVLRRQLMREAKRATAAAKSH